MNASCHTCCLAAHRYIRCIEWVNVVGVATNHCCFTIYMKINDISQTHKPWLFLDCLQRSGRLTPERQSVTPVNARHVLSYGAGGGGADSPRRAAPSSTPRSQTRWCRPPSCLCPGHSSPCQTWKLEESWTVLCSTSTGSCSRCLHTNTQSTIIFHTAFDTTCVVCVCTGTHHRPRSLRWMPGPQSSFRWCGPWRSAGSVACWRSTASADCPSTWRTQPGYVSAHTHTHTRAHSNLEAHGSTLSSASTHAETISSPLTNLA